MIHLLPILRRLYYTTLRRNLGSSLANVLLLSYIVYSGLLPSSLYTMYFLAETPTSP
jgi:hypothetical protein